MRTGLVRAIADAASDLPRRAPSGVEERVAWTLFDNIGSMLYASMLPHPMAAAEYFSGAARDASVRVLTTGLSSSEGGAAAAMAYLLHAAEIDDSDPRGELRASAVVMPPCLAAAQASDATGADFIRAAALAYTLQGRFIRSIGPIQARGWMASGVWGAPAAAAGVALLRKEPPEHIAAAMSLAAAASGGIFQYYFDQTDEKRVIVARAARASIESVDLAALGERGAARVLEGRAGLFRLFAGVNAPQPEDFLADLSDLEGPFFVRPKFFAASHSIIPTLEGLLQRAPADLSPGDIKRFIVRGDAQWGAVIEDKINDFKPPSSRIGAALNFSFVVALWLARRSVLPGDYTPEVFSDPAILALARSGSFEQNASQHLSIELVLRNGERIKVDALDPEREAQAPLSETQRIDKFNALAATRIRNAEKRAALHQHCMQLSSARSMKAWVTQAQSLCGVG